MLAYTLKRLALVVPSLLGVVTLTFLLIHLIPGDPVDMMIGDRAPASEKMLLRHELGLDLPLGRQYVLYFDNLVHGRLGRSLATRGPVTAEIARRFPATVELSIASLALAILWGLPLGVLSAVKQYSWRDHGSMVFGLIGMSVPGIFLGPALIFLFAMRLDWFPVSGRGGLSHLLLPAVSLALPLGAVILRMTRAAMLEVVREDYIRTARAKGLSDRRIYFEHALRNALVPIVTIVGLQLGALLTGTVITETIFDWPGIGALLYNSIERRDYPMVQGCVLLVAFTYVFVNLLTDLAYGAVNPKVRFGGD